MRRLEIVADFGHLSNPSPIRDAVPAPKADPNDNKWVGANALFAKPDRRSITGERAIAMTHPMKPADTIHPITLLDGTPHAGTVFLKPAIDHPNIDVGDYSYMSLLDPPDDPAEFAQRLAPYLYPGAPERLRIGKFCQFAHGARFVTASANHAMDGFSTYPFQIFHPDGLAAAKGFAPDTRDTVVGNDVWIGMDAIVLPGARIGNGVIIGAGSVVSGSVPDYAIMAGNPARLVRMRFDTDTIAALNRIAWWDWPIAKIEAFADAIMSGNVEALEAAQNAVTPHVSKE